MSINKPTISIVVPAWNAEHTILKTLYSIKKQTFCDWECIIVNDGSTDKTLDIIQNESIKDNRIKVISVSNGGAYLARLVGVNNATGDWITFIDSDDILDDTDIRTLINIAHEAGKSDIAVANLKFAGQTRKAGKSFVHKLTGHLDAVAYQRAMLEGKTTIGPVAKIYRRSLFEAAIQNLSAERFNQNEDLLMLLKLSKYCFNGVYIDPQQRVTYTYVRQYGSASSKKTSVSTWFCLFEEIHKSLIDNSITDALIRYELKIMLSNCILPGINIFYEKKQLIQLIESAKRLKPLSQVEKLTIILLNSPSLCYMCSYSFRLIRKLFRLFTR